MDIGRKTKRITFKCKNPNPQFMTWIEELYEEAKERGHTSQYTFKEAISSLQKYPLRLNSGAECAILNGFGKKLCHYIDDKLRVFKSHEANTNKVLTSTHRENCNPNLSIESACTKTPDPPKKRELSPILSPHSIPVKKTKIATSDKRDVDINAAKDSQKATNISKSKKCHKDRANNNDQGNTEIGEVKVGSQVQAAVNKKDKVYKPRYRTGPYAILVALFEHVNSDPGKNSLNKDNLIEKAQPMSEESFSRPKADSRYTAWSSMTKLITKGLIIKSKGRKPEYSLTDEGYLLACQLVEENKDQVLTNDIINQTLGSFVKKSVETSAKVQLLSSEPVDILFDEVVNFSQTSSGHGAKVNLQIPEVDKSRSQESIEMFMAQEGSSGSSMLSQVTVSSKSEELSQERVVEMAAGSFDIVLLVDKQETTGASKKNDPTIAQFQKYPDLKYELRHLKVGDFTWVARHRSTQEELVLPYIVERKRMDDFAASIKDGRFHEQKFRLRRCGVRRVLYLVEQLGAAQQFGGLHRGALQQAAANTRLQDRFLVHHTASLAHSCRFLAVLTKRLLYEYKNKHLIGRNREPEGEELMIFEYFNKAAAKNKPLTVTETFIKMLLQLKGLSVEKALAITDRYRTPRALIEAYKGCSEREGQMLVANLKSGDLGRCVGPALSKALYHLFTR